MNTNQDPSSADTRAAHLLTVESEDAGQRIDNFLVRYLKGVPKSRIYKMLRTGEVRINGGRIKPTRKLVEGDKVRIPPHRPGATAAVQAPGSRDLARVEAAILFEDDDLLVLDKPAGLAVHGGSGVNYGAIEALRKLRGQEKLELVHRLDRDTSGCLLVSKRRSLLRQLHERLRQGGMDKRYVLIVAGDWPEDLGEVKLPLHKYTTATGERRVRVDAGGKPSRTGFRRVADCELATLLEARLHTGRTHQIRVHARASGHAILGDEKYADQTVADIAQRAGIRRLCLHARSIAVEVGGRQLYFEAPPPAHFRQAWRHLGGDGAGLD